ncbi:hypothetical protein MBLNU457_1291t1 [Dothideomycetes sp. NU457]
MRGQPNRPPSAANLMRSPPPRRTSSRLSLSSKSAGLHTGSKTADDNSNTAVKVVIRVRPPLQQSDPGYDLIPNRFRASTCEVTSPTELAIQSAQGKKLFVFDRVFGPEVDQEGVWQYLSDCVDSFVQGYNVSILAYGQSGAGKSFTMGTSGSEEQHNSTTKGVVPRAAGALFEKLTGSTTSAAPKSGLKTPQRYSTYDLTTPRSSRSTAQLEKDWELKATYVEIYNEQLRDLLLPETTPYHERAQVSIREDTKGRILLTGLTQVEINSAEDILSALNFGSAIRQTDATAINSKSSRSHAVFTLNLVRRKTSCADSNPQEARRSVSVDNLVNDTVDTDSKLHFVDLAGSERLKNTGAQGERAKEGISINAGLASLGKVISQLSSRQPGSHVSYRDSRLTRLLQDSLGGNAITYMIACVTPPEFHLSETLNTVHYAQRARAIQSKPEVQQFSDEGDKSAKIERLQAEVAFLREQITHDKDQKNGVSRMHPDRRKATDLENQLLEMQESYTTLNQRHQRLIAELGRHGENAGTPSEKPVLDDALGGAAVDRLDKASSFAEAVEQVVLEYEKTIKSLENSLLNTRSSLSNSESSLLERESRIAYMENVAQQLQARIHKMSEREANSEAYLKDLESQLEGANSSEENSSSLVLNLRKELNRAKESQSSSEEYISTLEERLSEAEHDHDILKRELERLEQVVERQRSVGRLDNLMSDLDTIRQSGAQPVQQPSRYHNNKYQHDQEDPFGVKGQTPPSPLEPQMQGLGIEHGSNDEPSPVSPLLEDEMDDRQKTPTRTLPKLLPVHENGQYDHQSAQSKFMGDKLETLTQELFDLRGEHESTLTDYSDLQRKYTIALQSLAKLHNTDTDGNAIAGATSTRDAFLGRPSEEPGHQLRPGSPNSASLVHLSQPPYPSSLQHNSSTADSNEIVDPTSIPLPHDSPTEQVVALEQIPYDKHADLRELNQKNMKLAKAHSDALLHIERLKLELQKSRIRTPSPSRKSPLLRRKPSVDAALSMGNVDRANRAFASLRNIALDHFESNIDVRQNFEMQLNTIMTELHSRTEKSQGSDAELAALKKQVEEKTTIIAGLTRERTTLKATSAVDFSVVGQMQDQLMESENQIRMLQESHASRETDLHAEIGTLKARLGSISDDTMQQDKGPKDAEDEASRLREELANWQDKHNKTVDSMKSSESQMLATIAGLEATLQSMKDRALSREVNGNREPASAGEELEDERARHGQIVAALQKELQDHKAAGQEHTQKLSHLQQSHANILKQVEDTTKTSELNEQELRTHRSLVANLESQLQAHKSTVALHEQNLQALQTSHAAKLDELQTSHAATERKSNERYQALRNQHNHDIEELETEMRSHQDAMAAVLAGAAAALGHETSASKLEEHIQAVVDSQQSMEARHAQFVNDKATMQEELATVMANNGELQTRVSELKKLHEEATQHIARISKREEMSARLVQELEDQLHSNFDQSQDMTRRMSSIHSEKQLQLDEALHAKMELEKEIDDYRRRMSYLETQMADLRRRSGTPTLRDSTGLYRDSLSPEAAAIALARSSSGSSASHLKGHLGTALPSPPPAGPLPPLPGNSTPGGVSPLIYNGLDTRTVSPLPGSRPQSAQMLHNSIDSNNLAHIVEEQENRIRTVEKHLYAEKQLTATLEEALVDLETAQNRTRSEVEAWRKKASSLEDELIGLRKERSNSRASVQQLEEEREMRMRSEQARIELENRMRGLQGAKKKKKASLNCF